MKRDLLKTIVLMVSIVLVTIGSSLLLNLVTGPKIAADKAYRDELAAQQAAGALAQALPGATGFEEITSTLTIDPASGVTAVHKETSGKGYVVIAEKTNSPMKDMVVVTFGVSDGKVTGVVVEFKNEADYKVSDSTLGSFVGQDSTLAGVEITANATISSNTIKEAVAAGFSVLTANNLMKAATKTAEQVFEEFIPKLAPGFVKGSDLTASGNIYQTYKSANNTIVVAYVNKGETKLLALANVSGVVSVYETELLDEDKQEYKLNDVTADNADVVDEVETFVANSITAEYTDLAGKVGRLFENAENITQIDVNVYGSIIAAASFTMDGAAYYAYTAKTINGYNNSIVKAYIVLDSEGKIVVTDLFELFGDEEYFNVAHDFNEKNYEDGFKDLTDINDEAIISGATMTSNAVKQAMKDAFKQFASQGGNN